MYAGMALKAVGSVVNTHAQPNITLTPASPTELPAAKAVGPVVHNEPARNEPRPTERVNLPQSSVTHDAIIDPETNEVVHRLLDSRTRQVLRQVPEEALLRMRAYARAQASRALAEGKNSVDAKQPNTSRIEALV